MPVLRHDDLTYTLLSNASATGAGVSIRGGEYIFTAEGNISGATVALQMLSANGTWITVQAFAGGALVSMTTLPEAISWICLPAGQFRVSVTGGTPSGLYAYLHGLG